MSFETSLAVPILYLLGYCDRRKGSGVSPIGNSYPFPPDSGGDNWYKLVL